MIQIPREIKELFRSDNMDSSGIKKFKLKFYEESVDALYPYETLFPEDGLFPSEKGAPWMVIENNRILSESLQISQDLSSGNDLVFGSCESSELQITVADVIEDLTGKEFTISVEAGNYEISLGIYTVKSFVRESDRRKRKITAYDRMQRFNLDVAIWYNDISFPITLKEFRNSLCDYVGIKQNTSSLPLDSIEIEKTIDAKQLLGIDVLKAICEINGCFGTIDSSGMLKYIFLNQTGLYPSEDLFPEETLYPSELGGDGTEFEIVSTYKQPLKYEDYLVEGIDGLIIRQEEGDIGANVGSNGNVYTIEGNFLVYGKNSAQLLDIANSVFPYISGRSYRPFSIDCNCMPWIEVGDAIRVITRDDMVESFVMKRVISGCQNMRDKISSTGGKTNEEKLSVHSQIIQLQGKTAVISKTVDEAYVKISDLERNTESKLSVMDDQISAEVTRATQEERNLASRITVNAEQIELKVSKGNVSSQISVESDGVAIKSNRLSWESTNSSMTKSGILTCQNIKATNGTFSGTITGSTITGSMITGSTITANEISGGTVSGAEINGSKISGTEITASKVTAIGSINISVLSVDEITECGTVNANIGTFNYLKVGRLEQYSDKRLKTNIKAIPPKDAVFLIEKLNPVYYSFKESGNPGIGFIAQEVEQALRDCGLDWPLCSVSENGYYSIPYMNFIGVLVAGMQYLQKELERFENV